MPAPLQPHDRKTHYTGNPKSSKTCLKWLTIGSSCSRRAVRIDSQHARQCASAGRLIVRSRQFRGLTPKNSQRVLPKRGANHLHEGLLMRVVQTISGWPVLDLRTPGSGSTFVSFIRYRPDTGNPGSSAPSIPLFSFVS